jgi:sporulation-control protein spo0M
MGMYEYDPSKYENLHREAEMLASTESDPKYKHMLGLIEKAKEKALQSLANQDRRQAGIEGMDEDLYEGNKSLSELLK